MSRSCKSCSPADGNATRPHRRGFRQLSSLMNFRDEFLRREAVWPAASYVSHGHRWWHWQLALLQNTKPSGGSGQSLDKRIIWWFLLQKLKKGKHVANKEKSAIVLVLNQRAGMWGMPKCEGFLLRFLFTVHNRTSDCQGEPPLWVWTRRLLVLEKGT